MHRLDLNLYCHPKEFLGNGVRTHDNSKGKIPSTGKILLRGSDPQCCITQRQRAQHTANKLFRPNLTASSTCSLDKPQNKFKDSHKKYVRSYLKCFLQVRAQFLSILVMLLLQRFLDAVNVALLTGRQSLHRLAEGGMRRK